MTATSTIEKLPRFPWLGILLGVLYGLGLRLIAVEADVWYAIVIPQVVSLTFLICMPTIMGAITVWFGSEAQLARYRFRIFAPWVTLLGGYVIFFATRLETAVCLIMMFPIFALATSLGGLLGGWCRTVLLRRRRTTLSCVALLPLLLVPLESLIPVQTEYRTVATSVVIHAAPDRVWDTLTSVPDIRPEELAWSFSHAIGIPRPRAAHLDRAGIGGIRDIYWERGVHFKETITAWQSGQGFSYRVDASPAAHALRVLDTHVVIGDRHFDVTNGSYQLEALKSGDTRVTLCTTYRISTRVNFYGRPWADFVLDDFHGVVLGVIKGRAQVQQGV